MDPDEISLETIDKLFEYEKHSRFIDELDFQELKNFAKIYCKMYLRQQEVIFQIDKIEI
tara:strand:- start:1476 stop:1652 length:177 start_codon:yes stop_codon:yes gene_type:complete